jgi:Cu/Ag efflux protein CusF
MMKLNQIAGLFGAALAIAASPAVAQSVNGTVTKVNEAEGKLTIDHGPIKNLDMDGMTMAFRVADPAMLKSVKAGDRVRFDAERVNGAITVVKMQKAR